MWQVSCVAQVGLKWEEKHVYRGLYPRLRTDALDRAGDRNDGDNGANGFNGGIGGYY
jgi:hypothetical protein